MKYLLSILSLLFLTGCYTHLGIITPQGVYVEDARLTPIHVRPPLSLVDCNRYTYYSNFLYRECVRNYFKYRRPYVHYSPLIVDFTRVNIYNTHTVEHKPVKPPSKQIKRPRGTVYRSTKSTPSRTTRNTTRTVTPKKDEVRHTRTRSSVTRSTRSTTTSRSTQTEGRTRSQNRSQSERNNNQKRNNN